MASKLRSIERVRVQHNAKASEDELEATYGQLVEATQRGALIVLFNQRFPGRLMQLVKLGEAITAELKSFDTAQAKIVETYGGKLIEDTDQIEFGDNKAAADAEFQELLETKVTLKGPRLSDEELEASQLTAAQVMNLPWLWTK